jgi:hypothetical protein
MSYIVLRGRWCDIVRNAHAPTEEESDDSMDSFYKELKQVFGNFPKYHLKILLGNNAKLQTGYFQTNKWEREFPSG